MDEVEFGWLRSELLAGERGLGGSADFYYGRGFGWGKGAILL